MKKRALQAGYLLLPILLAGSIFLAKDVILELSHHFPRCPFYLATNFYCPACGNTRSVQALLRGEILSSLRYNIVPLVLLIVGILLYAELGTALFGRRRNLLPRKGLFWIIFGIGMAIYFVARNFFPLS